MKSIINELWHGNIIPQEDMCARKVQLNLKTRDMLHWAAEINNIKVCAEEIVFKEVIYK